MNEFSFNFNLRTRTLHTIIALSLSWLRSARKGAYLRVKSFSMLSVGAEPRDLVRMLLDAGKIDGYVLEPGICRRGMGTD